MQDVCEGGGRGKTETEREADSCDWSFPQVAFRMSEDKARKMNIEAERGMSGPTRKHLGRRPDRPKPSTSHWEAQGAAPRVGGLIERALCYPLAGANPSFFARPLRIPHICLQNAPCEGS